MTAASLARLVPQRFCVPSRGEWYSMARVVLAMSGGVDSSVAAHLLLQQGHEVIGVFMRHGEESVESCDVDDGLQRGEVTARTERDRDDSGVSHGLAQEVADAIGRHVLSAEAIFADDTPISACGVTYCFSGKCGKTSSS